MINPDLQISLASPLPLLLEYAAVNDWAIELGTLERISDLFERHYNGVRISAEAVEKIVAARDANRPERQFEITYSGVAIIPISGIIAKHSRMVNGISSPQGTSIETLRSQLTDAMREDSVRSILLDIESPGGIIDGLADFADELYQARRQKPIVAYADDICASAAYWLASQSQKLFANQTADVGSIGVYTLYVDSTKMAEQKGLKFYIFRSGQHKGIGSPGIQITEENRKVIQERIDAKYEVFIAAVLRGRAGAGLNEKRLRALADGRCYVGRSNLVNRLVDGIGNFAEALAYAEEAEIENRAESMANTKIKETVIMLTRDDLDEKELGMTTEDDDRAEIYEAAVEEFITAGLSKAKAYEKAAHKFPKAHEAWVQEQPRR